MAIKGMNHFLPWGAMDQMKQAMRAAMAKAWGPP